MKKALFIAYHFPPTEEIGGSVRSEKFIKYLSAFGWDAKVVALKEEKNCSEPEIHSDVVRVKSLTPYDRPYHVVPYGWALNIWLKLKEVRGVDLIYVSCPPFPQIISSIFLKKRLDIPLILDFRDAWSLDPNQEGSRLKRFVYKYIFPKVEKYTFGKADGIILNTPAVLKGYQSLYPQYAKKMSWIPNGYDEDDFCDRKINLKDSRKRPMRLLYCGRFGVCGRTPTLLFEAIDVVRRQIDIELIIYGKQPESLSGEVERLELGDVVILKGQIPHVDVIRQMFQHDVLVLYQESALNSYPSIASKTYDYIRTGLPVLSIGPLGDNQDLIKRFVADSESINSTSVVDVVKAITSLHERWLVSRLKTTESIDPEYEKLYERKNLTRQLATCFNSAVVKS